MSIVVGVGGRVVVGARVVGVVVGGATVVARGAVVVVTRGVVVVVARGRVVAGEAGRVVVGETGRVVVVTRGVVVVVVHGVVVVGARVVGGDVVVVAVHPPTWNVSHPEPLPSAPATAVTGIDTTPRPIAGLTEYVGRRTRAWLAALTRNEMQLLWMWASWVATAASARGSEQFRHASSLMPPSSLRLFATNTRTLAATPSTVAPGWRMRNVA